MGWGKIKIRPADALYSKFLRAKHKYICERCKGYYPPESRNLSVSHFHGRRNECVRFDEQNTDVLCSGCHRHFEENPNSYVDWKRKRMTEQEFNMLDYKAHQTCKKDDTLILLWLKEEIKKIEL